MSSNGRLSIVSRSLSLGLAGGAEAVNLGSAVAFADALVRTAENTHRDPSGECPSRPLVFRKFEFVTARHPELLFNQGAG